VAGGALRCTLGRATTEEEVDLAAREIVAAVTRLRSAASVV
jgi:cysteine sulfinate desulfinase/cysteine desulfurase-like protein